jgi:hypothetical protein
MEKDELKEEVNEETQNLFLRIFKRLLELFRGISITDIAENDSEKEILDRINQINENYHDNIIKVEKAREQGIMPGAWISQEIVNSASDVDEQSREEAEEHVNETVKKVIDEESLIDSEELEDESSNDLTTQENSETHEKQS